MSVNDPFVVSAFADKLGGKHLVNYIADGNGDFTKALGLDFDLSAVQLGHIRTKRMSMIIDDGKVSHFNNEDGPAFTDVSACSTVLKQKGK
jgi:glutaredoxin/glutathione-dependent peroxiredoxin